MPPLIAGTIGELQGFMTRARHAHQTVGLVPTMGALHAGHASLVRAARAETGFVVVSIFVNPTQFGPHEDFHRYPRPRELDLELCAAEGVDLVFAPDAPAIYPPGFGTYVEVPALQDLLEGASRPGHFRGVATVVLKLFQLVRPDRAYFGQKDAQQVRVIEQMVHDLNVPIEVRVCPIVRESDGLALSSRNRYLDPGQRQHARVLFQALERAQALIEQGERDASKIETAMRDLLATAPGAEVDYAVIVDAQSLRPLSPLQGRILILLAVKFGSTRLIDNRVLEVAGS